MSIKRFFFLLICLFPFLQIHGATIEIQFSAIEKTLNANVFTQGGRYYLEGGPNSKCSYALLENLKLFKKGDRLAARLHFSGKKGTMVAGKCIGGGTTSDIEISGRPYFRNGVVGLEDFRIDRMTNLGLFSGLARGYLQDRFSHHFSFPLTDFLRRDLGRNNNNLPVQITLVDLQINGITVNHDRLVLAPEFHIKLQ